MTVQSVCVCVCESGYVEGECLLDGHIVCKSWKMSMKWKQPVSVHAYSHSLTHTQTLQSKTKQMRKSGNSIRSVHSRHFFPLASVCLYHFLACNRLHTHIHLQTYETYMFATEHGINWPLMPPASCLLFHCCNGWQWWRWWWWCFNARRFPTGFEI